MSTFIKLLHFHRRNSLSRMCTRLASSATVEMDHLQRNIGIMAHIDAGKTTTTERMLYYSGYTDSIGEVHDGDTIMDYMDQERNRGITITSAAIRFPWNGHHFNLIDTPGHVDFTMEVERSLRVLDGAVAVFDASAGVEAQSLTVWRQADNYKVPRICYLNKMDKQGAHLPMCLDSIKKELKAVPLLIQAPLGQAKEFYGLVDLIRMTRLEWKIKADYGKSFKMTEITSDDEVYHECRTLRSELMETLADLDNGIAEIILEKESYDNILASDILAALRRVTSSQKGVPILMGSSYKNIGVQPLMDAIIDFLPSPPERDHPGISLYEPSFCALVFKILRHQRLGFLTFVRVYSGTVEMGQQIYNINKGCYEKIVKIYIPYADEFKDVRTAKPGSIIAITGLKHTITGDTLVLSKAAADSAKRKAEANSDHSQSQILMGVQVPEPVFMCSIEASSLSQQKSLEEALEILTKEDPSLRVKVDEDTDQTILSGMGELHLEIIKDRICKEYKLDIEFGPLEVSYRELVKSPITHTFKCEKVISGKTQRINLTLSLNPQEGYKFTSITCQFSKDNQMNLKLTRRNILEAISRGVNAALMTGPLLGFPLIDVEPSLLWCEVGRGTSDAFVASSASQCIHEMLRNHKCDLLEPVMKLEISYPEHYSSLVLGDLSKRRADIVNLRHRENTKIVEAICPLSELVGYSSAIRMMTSGVVNFSMEFSSYRRMNEMEAQKVILSLGGGFSFRR